MFGSHNVSLNGFDYDVIVLVTQCLVPIIKENVRKVDNNLTPHPT